MKKDFMQHVYSVKNLGYFDGLPNEEKIREGFKSKYKLASNETKEMMDSYPDLFLNVYTKGIAQQNYICRKLDNINKIMVFFLVVGIVNIVSSIVIVLGWLLSASN